MARKMKEKAPAACRSFFCFSRSMLIFAEKRELEVHPARRDAYVQNGSERIRTSEPLRVTRFPSVRHRPLGHASVLNMIGHSATFPLSKLRPLGNASVLTKRIYLKYGKKSRKGGSMNIEPP
jgi:hypothetical protein